MDRAAPASDLYKATCSKCGVVGYKAGVPVSDPLCLVGRPLVCRKCFRTDNQKRRDRIEQNGGKFSRAQFRALVDHYCPDGRCLCCQQVKKLGPDHVTPLSRGGRNSIGNIQPLCASCNTSKNGRNCTDYRPDGGAFARSIE